MRGNTLLFLALGALVLYVMSERNASTPSYTANPSGGQPPAADPVAGIVAGGLGFINNVFEALKGSSVSQSQPLSR